MSRPHWKSIESEPTVFDYSCPFNTSPLSMDASPTSQALHLTSPGEPPMESGEVLKGHEQLNTIGFDAIVFQWDLLILQTFRRFTYVTAHSPTLPSLYLHHSSFSNPSVASTTSQLILQPFFLFSYVTGSSLNVTWRAAHAMYAVWVTFMNYVNQEI